MQLSLQRVIPEHLRSRVGIGYSGIWANDINIMPGAYVFVKAPSGAGKTTLLHILYGLRKDYAGAVKWGEVQLATADDEKLAALRKKSISIIFQDLRLFPTLTVWENIAIKNSLTNTVSENTISEWLDRLGIGNKKDALAATLSYGEQQRVAIIRALVQPLQWLLMDEPFSHLDHANCEKAAALISEVVKQQGAGMLLADLETNTYFTYTQTLEL